MPSQIEPLLPILRSRLQGNLLAMLYLHPDEEFSLSRLATLLEAPTRTVQHEATRLATTNLVTERRVGNARLIRATTGAPFTRPLTDLLAVTYGPVPVLTEALRDVDGIDHAFIYGSWAARYQGEHGHTPNDVDVLVVGVADRDQIFEAAMETQKVLCREVNIYRMRPSTWYDTDNPSGFVRSLRERPLVELDVGSARKKQRLSS